MCLKKIIAIDTTSPKESVELDWLTKLLLFMLVSTFVNLMLFPMDKAICNKAADKDFSYLQYFGMCKKDPLKGFEDAGFITATSTVKQSTRTVATDIGTSFSSLEGVAGAAFVGSVVGLWNSVIFLPVDVANIRKSIKDKEQGVRLSDYKRCTKIQVYRHMTTCIGFSGGLGASKMFQSYMSPGGGVLFDLFSGTFAGAGAVVLSQHADNVRTSSAKYKTPIGETVKRLGFRGVVDNMGPRMFSYMLNGALAWSGYKFACRQVQAIKQSPRESVMPPNWMDAFERYYA